MTYKIKRTIHPEFQGKKLEAEVELTLTESTTKGPNDSGDMPCNSMDAIKVLWITDEQGQELWHHGNGRPAQGSISPELGLVINAECERIEDLEPERGEDGD
jgi:hypothetical protein